MSSVTKMKSNKITPLSISNRTPSNSKTTSSRISSSTTGSLFNVARVKKVELSDLNKNGGSAVERLSKTNTSGNVLRKVASITATANTDTSKKQQESKPSFVPEKLNFGAYEKFEGQMLINWFQSTLSGGTVNTEDSAPSRLVLQCCTNLLVAGVIKQIPDKHAAVQDVFKPNLMYQWTHTEVPKLEAIPGKLNSSDFWPHTDDSPTPTPKMPSITFTSTPKILNDVSNQLPKLADVKNIINKCETMDELCNTMQQLMLQESANMRNTNSFNDNCSPIIKKQNNLSINNNNDGDDDKSVSDMSEYRTGSASMFQSALDKTDLLKFDNSAINEIESDVKVKEIGVQTEMINNNCEEKEIQTISVRTENKEIQTDNSESEKNLIKSEEKTETPMNPVNSAPLPPPPPPPPIMNNIPKPPPMMIPNQGIPKPPPLVPAGTISSCPVPPPPMPMGMTSNGPPIPPPAPTGKPPGAMNPPALPLPKQTDWQTTITLRKPVKNPPKPMKPLFWTRIVTKPPVTTPIQIETDAVDATEPPATLGESEKTPELWQEIDETSLDNLDEFTELFSRQVVAPKQKTRDEKARPAKVETIKVLDSKRSQTVGIFARSLHVGFEEIEHAIYHCDTSVVSLETLQHIMAIKATPDELAQIKEVATGDVPLDAPEKFLLHISKISSFSERISCIVLQAEFDEAVSTVSRKLETIIRVCTFIIESDNLKIIFSIILTLGNYMNGGNRTRGQADGFGLEILGKLKDVKSKDSKITLLHFIVKTFIQQARKNGTLITELVLPIPDPTDIDKSLNVDFDDCKQQLNILQSKLNSCRKTIDVVISASGDSANPFKDKMNAFLEEATLRLENKFEKLEKSKKIFIQALAFYKFNPKSGTLDECTPSQFFELWTPFTHDFRDIWIKEIDVLTNEIIKKSKKASVKSTKSNSTSQPSGKQPSKLKQRIAQLRNRDN
uniref:CSON010665 protein n=1 Tax=Culicoides sonorensis TaxID=179676 RepID=A0A336M7H3_CULSO